MPEFFVYPPLDAPMVEVLVDDQWWPGIATMRTTHRDSTHTWHVRWHRSAGEQFVDTFDTDHCRIDETSWELRRGGTDVGGDF